MNYAYSIRFIQIYEQPHSEKKLQYRTACQHFRTLVLLASLSKISSYSLRSKCSSLPVTNIAGFLLISAQLNIIASNAACCWQRPLVIGHTVIGTMLFQSIFLICRKRATSTALLYPAMISCFTRLHLENETGKVHFLLR